MKKKSGPSENKTPLAARPIQYGPKIMHAQELLFAYTSRELLAATCGMLVLEYFKNFFAIRCLDCK